MEESSEWMEMNGRMEEGRGGRRQGQGLLGLGQVW